MKNEAVRRIERFKCWWILLFFFIRKPVFVTSLRRRSAFHRHTPHRVKYSNWMLVAADKPADSAIFIENRRFCWSIKLRFFFLAILVIYHEFDTNDPFTKNAFRDPFKAIFFYQWNVLASWMGLLLNGLNCNRLILQSIEWILDRFFFLQFCHPWNGNVSFDFIVIEKSPQ